jgi:hypothetical protein
LGRQNIMAEGCDGTKLLISWGPGSRETDWGRVLGTGILFQGIPLVTYCFQLGPSSQQCHQIVSQSVHLVRALMTQSPFID